MLSAQKGGQPQRRMKMFMQRENNELVFRLCACGSDHTCPPDVHGFSVAVFFYDFGGDVAKRAGERGELLVRRMEKFFSVKR